jgi:hypothetical protein
MSSLSDETMSFRRLVKQDPTPVARLALLDGPCDRPKNHGVLIGAMLAQATPEGNFANSFGTVTAATVTVNVISESSSFHVSYNVQYDNGDIASLGALELLRKFSCGLCGHWYCLILLTFSSCFLAEGFLLYRRHGGRGGTALTDPDELSTLAEHIRHLVILNNDARNANVMGLPVCRYLQIGCSVATKRLVIGYVT